MFSVDQIAQATRDDREKIAAYWPLVVAAMREHGIYTHACQIAVIATVAVECDWAALVEQGDCSYLEGRADLGNTQPGDGCRFLGRGFVQVTGRANYAHYGALLGIDLLAHPERAADPAIAAQTLARYFQDHGIPAMAQRGDWRAVRVTVNGGITALSRFLIIVNTLAGMAEVADSPLVEVPTVRPHLHFSQLHPNGSGENDCFEACLAALLIDFGKRPASADHMALLDEISRKVRNAPDVPDNPATTLGQAAAGLQAYGLPADWTDDLGAASRSAYAILLVDAYLLEPSQYPSGWLGSGDTGEADHFVLWWPGQHYLFMDPLQPDDVNNTYTPESVAAAFRGAYIFDGQYPQPTPKPVPPAQAPKVIGKATIIARCGVKAQPNHASIALTYAPAGVPVQVLDRETPHWRYVQAGHYTGWVLKDNLHAG